MVTERKVELVRHLQGPQFLVRYKRLRCVETQQFSRHTNRIQRYEECVSATNMHVNCFVFDIIATVAAQTSLVTHHTVSLNQK